MPPWTPAPGSSVPSECDCPSAHWVFRCTGHRSLDPPFIYLATSIETTMEVVYLGAGTHRYHSLCPWEGGLLSLQTQLVSQNE